MSDIVSPSLSLPLELVDSVIDFLAGDQDAVTLRNFSLANRHFAYTCRKHLFATVRLVQTMQHGTLDESNIIYDHPSRSFKRLLQTNPALASYVRDFELETMVLHNIPDDMIPPENLERVTSFTFGFSQGNRDSSLCRMWGSIPSITSFLERNRITKLHLFGIKSIPKSLFQSLPHLKNLDIRNCTIDFISETQGVGPAKPPPISLASLGLLYEIDQPTVKGFVSSDVFDIGHLLELHYIIPDDNDQSKDTLGQVLSRIDRLRRLQIEIEGEDAVFDTIILTYLTWVSKLADLSGSSIHNMIVRHLTSSSREFLRVVSVDVSVLDPMIEDFVPFVGLEDELKQLSTSNSVEEISLSIFLTLNDELNAHREAWFTRGDAFRFGFPRLRKLDLTIDVGIYSSDEKLVESSRIFVQSCLNQSLDWARNHPGLVVTSKVDVAQV